MATQSELEADLQAVLSQQVKTGDEIKAVQDGVDTLKANVARLEAVIATGTNVTPTLAAAVAAVKAQAQVVDDLIPDAVPVVTPPVETPRGNLTRPQTPQVARAQADRGPTVALGARK